MKNETQLQNLHAIHSNVRQNQFNLKIFEWRKIDHLCWALDQNQNVTLN